jgi:Arc/MetJ-type ribon-helix-helix transcriptional regulator
VRIADPLWDKAGRVAKMRGESRSDLIRTALERLLRDYGYDPDDEV